MSNNYDADVVVVGMGMSGIALSKELAKNSDIKVIGVDAGGPDNHSQKIFLTSDNIAKEWGVENAFAQNMGRRDGLINGVRRLNSQNREIDEIIKSPDDPKAYGYLPLTGNDFLRTKPTQTEMHYKSEVVGVELGEGEQLIKTSNGEIRSKLTIDATGYQANIIGINNPLPGNGLVMGIYGGNMPSYNLPIDSLVFPRRNTPDNHWGWAMPIGRNTTEFVVAEMIKRKDVNQWRNDRAEKAFEQAIRDYSEHGINLFPRKASKHHMGFAVQPIAKEYYNGSVIPFGEAEGANDPLNGQLINRVTLDAKALARIITEAKEKDDFSKVGQEYYKTKLGYSAANVLIHRIFAEGRRLGIELNNQSAVSLLGVAIKDVFPDKLWDIQMGGHISGEIVKKLIINKPKEIAKVALLSAPIIMKLFFTENQLFKNLIPFK